MSRVRVLYITYDGLTDPLGQSQILPYLFELSRHGREFTILSFEKPERFRNLGPEIRSQLQKYAIHWRPLSFTRRPKYLAKGWDLLRMYGAAAALVVSRQLQIVHCRSYQAGQVGLFLKWLFRVKMIFDMRGLWADERVDGGLWHLQRPEQKMLYYGYRWLESKMLRAADQIVTLTHRSLPILEERSRGRPLPLSVIPCCADFEHFNLANQAQRQQIRDQLGLRDQDLLLGYLGSLGTWYLLEEMFRFFQVLLEHQPDSHFLFITLDWQEHHELLWKKCGLGGQRQRLHIQPATRAEVPQALSALDLAVSFIRPSFSKLASSPTKMAEILATGVPLVCNQGVGDVQQLVDELQAGLCLKDFSRDEMLRAVKALPQILGLRGQALRARASSALGLPVAVEAYRRLYDALDQLP